MPLLKLVPIYFLSLCFSVHILNHVHTTLGQPWKTLSDYIFAFEAENEAMIGNVRPIAH